MLVFCFLAYWFRFPSAAGDQGWNVCLIGCRCSHGIPPRIGIAKSLTDGACPINDRSIKGKTYSWYSTRLHILFPVKIFPFATSIKLTPPQPWLAHYNIKRNLCPFGHFSSFIIFWPFCAPLILRLTPNIPTRVQFTTQFKFTHHIHTGAESISA